MSRVDPNALVGMPYRRDFNCADFVQHVQRVMFGRQVRLPGGGVSDPSAKAPEYGWERTESPMDGDLVLMFEIGRPKPDHVGVFFRVGPEPCVLHLTKTAQGSVLTRVRELGALGLRIEGYYRPFQGASK